MKIAFVGKGGSGKTTLSSLFIRHLAATGAPVIPVARWGTQTILPYGTKKPKLWPRQTVRTVAGKPVDLSRWAGATPGRAVLDEMTDAIMVRVRDLLAEIREGDPPPLYDAPSRRRNPPAVTE